MSLTRDQIISLIRPSLQEKADPELSPVEKLFENESVGMLELYAIGKLLGNKSVAEFTKLQSDMKKLQSKFERLYKAYQEKINEVKILKDEAELQSEHLHIANQEIKRLTKESAVNP